ncbi:class I SAM-dependent methyltransferase [Ruegeria pomeroyi]|uniref:class I SAM-dependent methyltransferase n=1 Tax=Ruegeria pomeroyi TaxID=89184 RepID=UPI001F422A7F|nr:class I SAM-dependent methyltransferase [Ruegeria pomeroyi]MCE8510819.1 class I SAM-dependent methyltransferase [Ruegeria pomeroyi]
MSETRDSPVLRGYAAAAEVLCSAWEGLSSEAVLAPVLGHLPERSGRCLDLGAGSGWDAAWLAGCGHQLWAVEPVAGFRAAGRRLHGSAAITWVDDTLPDLTQVCALGLRFDLILAIGVFLHLAPAAQHRGLIAALSQLSSRGRMILSLRHGPTPVARPGHPVDADALARTATGQGMRIRRLIRDQPPVQPGNRAAGVRRDWLCLSRE